jgi:multisubunit Na+/H+ antiporter MnhG subunit
MNEAAKERLKLTATWFNTISAGSVTVGVIAPLAALEYLPNTSANGAKVVIFSIAWLTTGMILHFVARALLDGLER